MRKYAFVKNMNTNKCHCGKCGKIVLQDEYNWKKHASVCGDIDSFFIESTTENADYFYELEAAEDTLLIKILTPHLVHRPGFADRYIRADWKAVYTVGLVQGRKAIKFLLFHSF